MVEAAAVYARISQDRDGDGLGVKRQLLDCRTDALRRGWPIAEEYVDDDASAYSGKARPAYQRMLADIRDGLRDAVVVWHVDRLHRRPIELEEFVKACAAAGLTNVVTLHGDLNLGTGDGLLVARLLAAVAANESDAKSRRSRRKMLEIAQAGDPHGGGTRPFGFEADKKTPRPSEAAVVRNLTERALAGESLTSLARWLAESDVPTVTGKTWKTPTLRGLLLNPRYAGLRAMRGEVIGTAVWQPIITEAQHRQLHALLTDPSRRTNRTARSYLLSGMCRCSRCDTVMVSASDPSDRRRYLCRSGHDFGGCGRMAITADAVDEMVTDLVLFRLDTPTMAAALTGGAPDTADASELRDSIDADTEQLAELATMYADRRITAEDWVTARSRIEQRRSEARKALARLSNTSALERFLGQGDALRGQWPALNLDRRRAVLKAVLSHVNIHPATPGVRHVDRARIDPQWRL